MNDRELMQQVVQLTRQGARQLHAVTPPSRPETTKEQTS